MKFEYDPTVDALSIQLADRPSVESDEVRDDVIFDYDAHGKLIAIELLNASKLFPKEFRPTKGAHVAKLARK